MERLIMSNDPFNWDDMPVVTIGRDIYCTRRSARQKVMHTLRQLGYRIDDRTTTPDYDHRTHTVAELAERRRNRYYAHLDNRRGKCGSCHRYISTQGILAHNHTCEKCGAVTYREIVDGSTVRFCFVTDSRNFLDPELKLTAKKWDGEHIWFYAHDLQGRRGLSRQLGQNEIAAYLAEHSDKWCYDQIDGDRLIKVFYQSGWCRERDKTVIDVGDIWGHEQNHSIVRVWRGREYSGYDFPVPESILVYETWCWQKLAPSPTLHERIFSSVGAVSDCGWYHQDGRAHFSRAWFEEMGKFIKHFTTLDYEAWQRFIPHIPLDGPGAVIAIAHFCHPNPRIENAPNIGNVLVAAGKAMSGQSLHPGELAAAIHGLSDPSVRQVTTDLIVGYTKEN